MRSLAAEKEEQEEFNELQERDWIQLKKEEVREKMRMRKLMQTLNRARRTDFAGAQLSMKRPFIDETTSKDIE